MDRNRLDSAGAGAPWRQRGVTLAVAGACAVLAGCFGGGGGGGSGPGGSDTSAVGVKVIDGAILNALVCVDANANGACDTGETSGRTDASGNVTLQVPAGD